VAISVHIAISKCVYLEHYSSRRSLTDCLSYAKCVVWVTFKAGVYRGCVDMPVSCQIRSVVNHCVVYNTTLTITISDKEFMFLPSSVGWCVCQWAY